MKTTSSYKLIGVVFFLVTTLVGCNKTDELLPDNQPSTSKLKSSYDAYFSTGSYGSTTDNSSLSGYTIYRPTNMNAGPYPIISWGNGTGSPTIIYNNLLKHLASQGFVIVASSSIMTGSGTAIKSGVEKMITLNSTSRSVYYQKLDISNIGLCGHSQGGQGATNAALNNSKIKALVPIMPAPIPFTTSGINCPTFVISGTLDMICSPILVKPIYNNVNSSNGLPYLFSTKSGVSHTSWIFSSGGSTFYGNITLWFSAFLKNDDTAKSYFVSGGTFQSNNTWTNQVHRNL